MGLKNELASSTRAHLRHSSQGPHEPVEMWARQVSKAENPMYIPINAATSVEIKGERYLHGWLQHRFGGAMDNHLRMAARAHQFSSFLLVVGTMAGPDKFKPKSAIILQNKDEVVIPLITEMLPSAKAFKDAIQSLSPEQQAFAKAFRAMQLESSVFGVCVIQLKPQLEKLLGLPSDSLTKEIKLTQELMSLFVDYQIPSDLLSVNHGFSNSNTTEKLSSVRANVKTVMDVIDQAKEEQLREEKRKAEMRESMYPTATPSSAPSSSPSGSPSVSSASGASRSHVRKLSLERSGPLEIIELSSFSAKQSHVPESEREESSAPSHSGTRESSGESEDSSSIPESSKEASQSAGGDDFTIIPGLLDSKIEQFDKDGSLRSTTMKTNIFWERQRKENLLTPSQQETLLPHSIELETKKAFDLLDALSRSGNLAIEQSALHVIITLSHSFEDDIMSTVVRENINPIDKVETSALLLASTIHGKPVREIVGDGVALDSLLHKFPVLSQDEI